MNKKNRRIEERGGGREGETGWLSGEDIAQKPPIAEPIYRRSRNRHMFRSTDVSMNASGEKRKVEIDRSGWKNNPGTRELRRSPFARAATRHLDTRNAN